MFATKLRNFTRPCRIQWASRALSSGDVHVNMGMKDAIGKGIDTKAKYNPEWKAEGYEGGVDTHSLPWIEIPQMAGCSMKPLRVSDETGAFTAIVKARKGTILPTHVHLGPSDTFILSGKMRIQNGPMAGSIGPGMWGYTPAGAKMEGTLAEEDTEYLATFYGPVAFLDESQSTSSGVSASSILTGQGVREMARKAGSTLLPNTLAAAIEQKSSAYSGPPEPLAATDVELQALCSRAGAVVEAELSNPYYVDTNSLPWIIDPDAPDIGLKVMRVSAETGSVSLIVRQNGQAPPHYHLGPADFFITSGRIGYRAGPEDGFGPGTYMYEPAGARHEATQRITDDDLIYTANVWGPIQFDSGVGSAPLMVMSWMTYLAAAEAFNSPLIASAFPGDKGTMLAQSQ